MRLLPDFLIVGAQKCGTTSLYRYLIQHPNIPPITPIGHCRKEVRFFTDYFHYGTGWYKAHFPSLFYKVYIEASSGHRLTIGESTPSYMFNPLAPGRIAQLLPRVKLIVLLRNPIDRAYSHYQHVFRIGKDTLTFEEALKREPERLQGEREKIVADGNYTSFEYGYHSYLTRGVYADQIEQLFHFFSKENILILNTEAFFSDPRKIYKKTLHFLELPFIELAQYKEYNTGDYQGMHPKTRKRLSEYFSFHNQRLFKLIGEEYAWS
jgi:hypothetical protein